MTIFGYRFVRADHAEGDGQPSRLSQLREKLAGWPKWTALTLLVWVAWRFMGIGGAMWKYDYIRSHFVWPMIALLIVFAIVLFAMGNRTPQAQAHHGGEHAAEQPAEATAPADAPQAQQAAPAAQSAAQPAANPTPNPAPQAHG